VKVDTVRLRVADLGFPEGALTREIIGSERDRDLFGNSAPFTGGRGNQLGLELCPPDVGPHLRLEFTDQPSGERLYVAMKPIPASDGEPRIFVVAHDSTGLSLDAARARSDDKWAPDDIFVFCLGQSTSHDSQ
jgi:hypothetical protein